MEISLSQLCYQITSSLQANFDEQPIWVRAEISELNVRGGHCYMELIERSEGNNTFLAKVRATCWANLFGMLKPYFETETGESLRVGIKVLLAVSVEFHAVYGLSLNIKNIDPTYTVGDMARQRQQIIARLKAEGIMEMNKEQPFNILPQRIAVISSETAAGYGDFCHQLKQNPSGFAFRTTLFPAIMQGDKTERSIITALEKIYESIELFDVVVLIRGGGATADLSCFDQYELALNCAQFPLPIIAGIGHQRDVSVLDLVAHTSVKTPTAAAEYLINKMQLQEQRILLAKDTLLRTKDSFVKHNLMYLDNLKSKIKNSFSQQITKQQYQLSLYKKTIELHSPERILKQGYTITLVNGKPITSVKEITADMQITTQFADGKVDAIVLGKKK